MDDEVQTRTARHWQISIASLFVVVTATATILILFQPEQPERSPPPIVPATETERIVLTIANQFARTRSTDFNVPIAIDKRTDDGTFAVIYWTPQRELELLGERIVIVNRSRAELLLAMGARSDTLWGYQLVVRPFDQIVSFG